MGTFAGGGFSGLKYVIQGPIVGAGIGAGAGAALGALVAPFAVAAKAPALLDGE